MIKLYLSLNTTDYIAKVLISFFEMFKGHKIWYYKLEILTMDQKSPKRLAFEGLNKFVPIIHVFEVFKSTMLVLSQFKFA